MNECTGSAKRRRREEKTDCVQKLEFPSASFLHLFFWPVVRRFFSSVLLLILTSSLLLSLTRRPCLGLRFRRFYLRRTCARFTESHCLWRSRFGHLEIYINGGSSTTENHEHTANMAGKGKGSMEQQAQSQSIPLLSL